MVKKGDIYFNAWADEDEDGKTTTEIETWQVTSIRRDIVFLHQRTKWNVKAGKLDPALSSSWMRKRVFQYSFGSLARSKSQAVRLTIPIYTRYGTPAEIRCLKRRLTLEMKKKVKR